MKTLAREKEIKGIKPEDFQPHSKAEAKRVWELYQQGFIREIYFRADKSDAVLILESDNIESARQILQTLPLVSAGLIDFEIIPLKAYPGFSRLFAENA